jgi:hypothetical protein
MQYLYDVAASWHHPYVMVVSVWWNKLHEHFQECSEVLVATKFATELTERENVVKFL